MGLCRRRRSMSLHEVGLHLNQSLSYLRPICTGYSPLTPRTSPPSCFFLRGLFLFCVVAASAVGWGGGALGSQLATYWLFQSLDPSVCAECITPLCTVTTCQVFRLRQDTREKAKLGGVGVEGLPASTDKTRQHLKSSDGALHGFRRWEPL